MVAALPHPSRRRFGMMNVVVWEGGTVNELYQRFVDTYLNLNLFPLLKSEDIERFRITHSPETLARLRGPF